MSPDKPVLTVPDLPFNKLDLEAEIPTLLISALP